MSGPSPAPRHKRSHELRSELSVFPFTKGLYSVEEDCNGSQLHPGEEISRKLVVTCGDGAEVLEQIEEALDQIAFTIECEVALPLDVSVGLGRNDRSDSTLGESFDERIGVISFVAN